MLQAKPQWAASIWCTGAQVFLELPPLEGNSRAHIVEIPSNINGLEKVLELIQARNAASKLGSKGSPTQHQISHDLKYDQTLVKRARSKVKLTSEQAATGTAILRDMGLL